MNDPDRVLSLAKTIADALGLPESETHRRGWDCLVYNQVNGIAVAPRLDRGEVFINALPLHLHIGWDAHGQCLIRSAWCGESPASPTFDMSPERGAWLIKADAATDGLIEHGLINAGDLLTLAWFLWLRTQSPEEMS